MTDDTRLDHADRDMDLGEASSSAAPHGCGGPLSPASSCGASSHAVEADAANGLSASFGDAARLPRRMHGYAMEESVLEDADESNGATGKACSKTPLSAPLLSRSEGHLCVRHQRMADEGANARLQKFEALVYSQLDLGYRGVGTEHTNTQSIDGLSLDEKEAVNTVWSLFSSSPHSRRALILRGILTMCCSSQLSLLSSEVAMAVRIDPFSLFPGEVSLRVLGYLDAISLGRAAQVSKLWRSLADNDMLWRNMCEQHIERKCEKCGWGLPRLVETRTRSRKRLRSPERTPAPDDDYRQAATAVSDGSLRRSITAAANAAALERRKHAQNSEAASQPTSPSSERGHAPSHADSLPSAPMRPWKAVYCERLAIERNWRYGRYAVRVLRGHTEGLMCLAFREKVSQLPYPVLMTGGYDRTVRVWNLATGETLRVLTGHARGVRSLQFDDVKLITGSMDRTLKIWNWRTGELLRTLEGHTEGIVSLCFDANILVSGSADSSIRVWNFHTGECYPLNGHRDWVNALQLWSGMNSSTGSLDMFLFSASDDFTIRLWDLQRRESIMVYHGHVGQVQSLKVVMMDVSTMRKLARGSTKVLGEPANDSDDEVKESATPMSASVMSHASDAHALPEHFFQAAGPSAPRTANGPSRRVPSTITRLHERLSAAGLVPALPTHATMDDVHEGVFDASCVEESPSTPALPTKKRPVLVTGSLDNTLKLWDIRTGRCFYTLFGHVEGVWSVDVDTLRIVSASHDRTIKVWDRDTGQCQTTLVGHRSAVTTVALGDNKIVSGSDDGDVRVWSFCPPCDT